MSLSPSLLPPLPFLSLFQISSLKSISLIRQTELWLLCQVHMRKYFLIIKQYQSYFTCVVGSLHIPARSCTCKVSTKISRVSFANRCKELTLKVQQEEELECSPQWQVRTSSLSEIMILRGLSAVLARLSRLESRLARYGAFKILVYERGVDLLTSPS